MSSRRFGAGAGSPSAAVSAGEVLAESAVQRVLELVDMGALVSVSRSRDGGAVALTVTWDGEWEREWFRDAATAQMRLDEWAGLIEDLSREVSASPAANQDARRRRSRRS